MILSTPRKKSEKLEIEEIPTLSMKDRPNIDSLQEMVKGRPYVMQIIQMQLLYDLCSMTESHLEEITRLKNLVEGQIPEGKSIPREYTVTSTDIEVIDRNEENTLPWRSVEIVNFGPDKLYISINENISRNAASFTKGESLSVDFRAPKIEKVLLKSEGSSTVRVYATK